LKRREVLWFSVVNILIAPFIDLVYIIFIIGNIENKIVTINPPINNPLKVVCSLK